MMVDRLTRERRSWNMSRIRSKNTAPEKKVRSVLHKLGYRFRLHRKDLPGKPDIVLPGYGTVIFVHGCFWHRHKGCKKAYSVKSDTEKWERKFQENIERDKRSGRELKKLGWSVRVVWECQTQDSEKLEIKLKRIMADSKEENCS